MAPPGVDGCHFRGGGGRCAGPPEAPGRVDEVVLPFTIESPPSDRRPWTEPIARAAHTRRSRVGRGGPPGSSDCSTPPLAARPVLPMVGNLAVLFCCCSCGRGGGGVGGRVRAHTQHPSMVGERSAGRGACEWGGLIGQRWPRRGGGAGALGAGGPVSRRASPRPEKGKASPPAPPAPSIPPFHRLTPPACRVGGAACGASALTAAAGGAAAPAAAAAAAATTCSAPPPPVRGGRPAGGGPRARVVRCVRACGPAGVGSTCHADGCCQRQASDRHLDDTATPPSPVDGADWGGGEVGRGPSHPPPNLVAGCHGRLSRPGVVGWGACAAVVSGTGGWGGAGRTVHPLAEGKGARTRRSGNVPTPAGRTSPTHPLCGAVLATRTATRGAVAGGDGPRRAVSAAVGSGTGSARG